MDGKPETSEYGRFESSDAVDPVKGRWRGDAASATARDELDGSTASAVVTKSAQDASADCGGRENPWRPTVSLRSVLGLTPPRRRRGARRRSGSAASAVESAAASVWRGSEATRSRLRSRVGRRRGAASAGFVTGVTRGLRSTRRADGTAVRRRKGQEGQRGAETRTSPRESGDSLKGTEPHERHPGRAGDGGGRIRDAEVVRNGRVSLGRAGRSVTKETTRLRLRRDRGPSDRHLERWRGKKSHEGSLANDDTPSSVSADDQAGRLCPSFEGGMKFTRGAIRVVHTTRGATGVKTTRATARAERSRSGRQSHAPLARVVTP